MTSTVDYDTLAKLSAGNWADFDCFAWCERPDNADQFCIVYTSHRDSELIDRANAQVIAAELEQFPQDVIPQRHSHWAVGYVDGYAIRIYDEFGDVTDAFRCWCDLQARISDYPILDESLYSELELEAQDESWANWARREFVRCLEQNLDVEIDESGDVCSVFEILRERANVYWESDAIDVERVAESATYDDVRRLIVPVFLTVYQDGYMLCTGSISGDEWQCDKPLYEDEWFACMEARDNGADSVTIGTHVYTWSAV